MKLHKVTYFLMFAGSFGCSQLFADNATDREMSEDALLSLYRIPSKSLIEEAKGNSQSFVENISKRPDTEEQFFSASLVFETGFSPEEVQSMATFYDVEISRAETKIPMGDKGDIFTISIGANSILKRDGTISEKLKMSVGSEQLLMMQRLFDEGDENSKYFEIALAPNPRFYKIEVIGDLDSIRDMSKGTDIAGVVIREDVKSVLSYRFEKERISSQRTNRPTISYRRLEDGLPLGISPDQVIYLNPTPSIDQLRSIQEKLRSTQK